MICRVYQIDYLSYAHLANCTDFVSTALYVRSDIQIATGHQKKAAKAIPNTYVSLVSPPVNAKHL